MILACPLCQTRFLIQASLLDAGPRQVRCARCHHTWLASKANEVKKGAPTAEPSPGHTPPSILMETPPPHKKGVSSLRIPSLTLPFTWTPYVTPARIGVGLFSLGAVFLLIWLITDRQEIAENQPYMENIYDAVGLKINHTDDGKLSFEQVRSELHYDSGLMKLVVEGKIHNGTTHVQDLPDIVATALGTDNQVLQSWQIDAPALRIPAGEYMPFHSEINAPKGSVVDLNLSFSEIKKNDDRNSNP